MKNQNCSMHKQHKMKAYRDVVVNLHEFLTLAVGEVEGSASRLVTFT
jgi:hypothetical protein